MRFSMSAALGAGLFLASAATAGAHEFRFKMDADAYRSDAEMARALKAGIRRYCADLRSAATYRPGAQNACHENVAKEIVDARPELARILGDFLN